MGPFFYMSLYGSLMENDHLNDAVPACHVWIVYYHAFALATQISTEKQTHVKMTLSTVPRT
jgi:hypothetical protein